MPHVNIKHFPGDLDRDALARIVDELTDLLSTTFRCAPGAVSIALEPVPPAEWHARVEDPELAGRSALLVKTPHYTTEGASS